MFNDKDTLFNINSDIKKIKTLKKHVSTAPTAPPKTFNEQIVFYKNGTTYRVYFYIGGWHYVALT